MIPAHVYAADEAEAQRQKQSTPRATALLQAVHEAEGEALDAEQRRSLEALVFALGLHVKFKEDITLAGVLSFTARLNRILRKPA